MPRSRGSERRTKPRGAQGLPLRVQVTAAVALVALVPAVTVALWLVPLAFPGSWSEHAGWFVAWIAGLAVVVFAAALFASHVMVGPLTRIARDLDTLRRDGDLRATTQIRHRDRDPREVASVKRSVLSLLQRIDEDRERRSTLLATLTHDINTSVVAARNVADLITRGRLPADDAVLSSLADELVTLHDRTRQLIDLLRCDRVDLDLRREPLVLRSLVGDAVARAREASQRSDVHVEVSGDAALEGDRAALVRAIENLLTNAVRHARTHARRRRHPSWRHPRHRRRSWLHRRLRGPGQTVRDRPRSGVPSRLGGEPRGHGVVRRSAHRRSPRWSTRPRGHGARREYDRAPSQPMTDAPPRLVVADDHPLFRLGLVTALQQRGLDVVGQAGDGDEALALVERHAPDLVILDVRMPRLNGIEVCRRITAAGIATRAVMLSTYDEPAVQRAAHDAGAAAYFGKDTRPDAIAQWCLRLAREPDLRLASAAFDVPELSARERQVLGLMAEGHSNKAIASALAISPETVKDHCSRLFAKFGTSDRLGTVHRATELGFFTTNDTPP